eukprot:3074918-Rhodomonas_salina.2
MSADSEPSRFNSGTVPATIEIACPRRGTTPLRIPSPPRLPLRWRDPSGKDALRLTLRLCHGQLRLFITRVSPVKTRIRGSAEDPR